MKMHSCVCCKDKTNHVLKISSILKILGIDSRLEIFCILNSGEHCVCELEEHLDISQSLISHHLSDLKKFLLVTSVQKGKNIYYSLTDRGKKIFKLLNKLSEEI